VSEDGTAVVAKKKADPKQNPESWNVKSIIMQLRGSAEYKAWLEGLAQFDATTVAEMAERAFAVYARQIGYNVSRPRR
jgi:hypothetical protein